MEIEKKDDKKTPKFVRDSRQSVGESMSTQPSTSDKLISPFIACLPAQQTYVVFPTRRVLRIPAGVAVRVYPPRPPPPIV